MTFDQQFSRMSDEELLKEVNLARKARTLSEDAVLWRSALLQEQARRDSNRRQQDADDCVARGL